MQNIHGLEKCNIVLSLFFSNFSDAFDYEYGVGILRMPERMYKESEDIGEDETLNPDEETNYDGMYVKQKSNVKIVSEEMSYEIYIIFHAFCEVLLHFVCLNCV